MLSFVHAGELKVITSVHSEFNQLSADTLRNLYLGREKFVSQVRVQVVDYRSSQNLFLDRYIRKKKKSYIRIWHMMVFTGKSLAPKEFKSKQELYEFVAKTKNVVAYTTESLDHQDIRVLKIIE
jgi:hypothetical protein